jgi:hypothetical protein
MGCGLEGRGIWVRFQMDQEIFSSLQLPNKAWVQLSLLYNGYR